MKCKITKDFWSRSIKFLFYEEHNGVLTCLQPQEDGSLMPVQIKVGQEPKASVIVTKELDDDFEFLSSLAKELESLGIKSDNDHKIQGVLEAQTAHLKDLRQLLKLK